MELKRVTSLSTELVGILLIVPYGIETRLNTSRIKIKSTFNVSFQF